MKKTKRVAQYNGYLGPVLAKFSHICSGGEGELNLQGTQRRFVFAHPAMFDISEVHRFMETLCVTLRLHFESLLPLRIRFFSHGDTIIELRAQRSFSFKAVHHRLKDKTLPAPSLHDFC